MPGTLRLFIEPANDGTAELSVKVADAPFAGAGSAWFGLSPAGELKRKHRTTSSPRGFCNRWKARPMLMAALQQAAMLYLSSAASAAQSNPVAHLWTLVRSEQSVAYYLDTGSVRTQGTYIAYWIMVNFSYDPRFDGAEPYKSAKLLRYASCSTREQDTKSLLQYHAPMGQGEPTYALTFEDSTIRMETPEPGSASEQILKFACSLRH
jgi:hypothetical protein